MMESATDEETKEIYAHFGLAYYCSSVLEHGIANAIFILEMLGRRRSINTRENWEFLVDQHFESSFEKTFGKLNSHLARHRKRLPILSHVLPDLERCVAERNFLAHHFWREYAMDWYTASGRERMVHKLVEIRTLFSDTDSKLEDAIRPYAATFGFTVDFEQETLDRMLQEAKSIHDRHRS